MEDAEDSMSLVDAIEKLCDVVANWHPRDTWVIDSTHIAALTRVLEEL